MPKVKGRNFGTKKHSNQGTFMAQRHSPLAFQVKKSLSKNNLLTSPSARVMKSPSVDSRSPLSGNTKALAHNRQNQTITMSHRANLNMSIGRTSNRGIVTMSSGNRLKSGTIRIKSGRRRSSMSQRSTESLTTIPASGKKKNEAVNGYYDRNLGKQFDRFK